jgi:hypothetical protein
MASIKKFGLAAIGANVQLGKKGPKVRNASGVVEIRNAADTDYAAIKALDVTATGNVVITGDLTVNGTTTYINTTELKVTDKNVTIANGSTSRTLSDGAGLTIVGGTDGDVTFEYTNSLVALTSNVALNVASGSSYKLAGVDIIDSTGAYLGSVDVAHGGTGATTLTDHGVLVGSGTDAVTALAVGTDHQVLKGATGADPAFGYQSDLYDSNGNALVTGVATTAAVNGLTITNAATAGAPSIAATGTDTNIDLVLSPKGTGAVSVKGTTDYEANVTDDDDLTNKAYVDQAISANSGSIVRRQVSTVSSATSINIGSVLPNPTDSIFISRITFAVTTAFAAASTIYARITDGTNVLMTDEELELDVVGTCIAELPMLVDSKNKQLAISFYSDAAYTTPLSVTSGAFTATVECVKAA